MLRASLAEGSFEVWKKIRQKKIPFNAPKDKEKIFIEKREEKERD